MMNNEKGLTLVELLAAITISSFILLAAIMMFSSIQLEWSSTNRKYEHDAEVRMTTNVFTRYLSDADKAYRTDRELRFTTFADGAVKIKSIYLNETNQLILYDVNTPNLQDPVTLQTPNVYTNPIVLSKHVNSISYWNEGGELTAAAAVGPGSVIKAKITFLYQRGSVRAPVPTPVTKEISIKLLPS